ncbi:MAG TPA: glycine cleavage T C-terminal barrel domain-containing protein [Thermoanaerobaculia bacterium]|nr:glycine cleavage T C-terminal barrel domain-containing protein [Thermoanaerobaculia bacterium]
MTTAPQTATPKPLPLVKLHQRLGAVLGTVDGGATAPLRYGPAAGEVRAVREGCGLADRSWTGRLEVLGADRHRFLNAYVTCDVKGLGPGEGTYGFFTNPKGGILSDVVVLVHEDRLWLQLPPGQDVAMAAHLRKYVLADRVEVRPLEDMLPLTLLGPRAAEVLGTEPPAAPAGDWRHVRATVHGTEVALQRAGRLGAEAYTLWVSASIATHLAERLLEVPGVVPIGFEALEVLRAEAGIARFGRDFGPENFPQETGAEEAAVSYTKGCYLGQEVVARIHYRGGVQKVLRGLDFAGPAPEPGTPLLHDGRESGIATTVVDSVALGRPLGLAILHKRAAEPGTRLDLPGGGVAEVREVPF